MWKDLEENLSLVVRHHNFSSGPQTALCIYFCLAFLWLNDFLGIYFAGRLIHVAIRPYHMCPRWYIKDDNSTIVNPLSCNSREVKNMNPLTENTCDDLASRHCFILMWLNTTTMYEHEIWHHAFSFSVWCHTTCTKQVLTAKIKKQRGKDYLCTR